MSQHISDMLRKEGALKRLLKDVENDYEAAMVSLLSRFNVNVVRLPLPIITKSESRSEEFRKSGNDAFYDKDYGDALSLYNVAIMHAPNRTLSLAKAYNNRSAVLYKLNKFDECVKDIETCLMLPHTPELETKLMERKRDCEATSQHINMNTVPDSTYEKCFQISGKPHKTVPCASDSIEIKDNKVVAARDISPGEIISVEKAYASTLKNTEVPLCCHYCHKFSYNLIPCVTCCYAMFCSDQCKQQSWMEVHKFECEIYKLGLVNHNGFRLSVQVVLKAVAQSSGWSQLMASVESAKKSKGYIEGPYAATSYQNLCTPPKYDQITRRGRLFECAINASLVVQSLSSIPSFYPTNTKEKKKAMVFLGKQIMMHCEKSVQMGISGAVILKDKHGEETLNMDTEKALGLFPFTRMLEHSCNPNVESFGLGNKITLVAVANIPKGTELVMSYWRNFIINTRVERKRFLFINFGFVCKCEACRGDWEPAEEFVKAKDLKPYQQDVIYNIGNMDKFMEQVNDTYGKGALIHYNTVCRGLGVFSESPKSVHYKFFMAAFHSCYNIYQAHIMRQYFEGVVDPHVSVETICTGDHRH